MDKKPIALVVHPEEDFAREAFTSALNFVGIEVEVMCDVDIARERLGVGEAVAVVIAYQHETDFPELGRDFDVSELVWETQGGARGVPMITFSDSDARDRELSEIWGIPHLEMPFDTCDCINYGTEIYSKFNKEGLFGALTKAGVEWL